MREAIEHKKTQENIKSRNYQLLSYDKPLNSVILGRLSWPLLHSMSLAYPNNPS